MSHSERGFYSSCAIDEGVRASNHQRKSFPNAQVLATAKSTPDTGITGPTTSVKRGSIQSRRQTVKLCASTMQEAPRTRRVTVERIGGTD